MVFKKDKEYEIIPVQYISYGPYFSNKKPLVSIVKINENWSKAKAFEYYITKTLDLIGGLDTILKNKERILIKPNLVGPERRDITNIRVIETLAILKENLKNH